MPQYAEVIYNPTEVRVATLNSDNTWGTPSAIDYLQKLSFEFEADTDELKSAGLYVESLAIITKAMGELSQGSLDFAGMTILCGHENFEYNTTPNRYTVKDVTVGGEGIPYFGMIVRYESILGGNLLVGFPKAKLETVPGFDVDQNKFRLGSANFNAYALSTAVRKAVRFKRNETAEAVPTTAGGFSTFFAGMF